MPLDRSMDLNLWKKHLGHVPDEVWENLEIETLVLADNDLTEVPTKIGVLKHLRTLDMGNNAACLALIPMNN
jgi:Leucine-rich repeat (LRR) protein